jgi:hypothetical protein
MSLYRVHRCGYDHVRPGAVGSGGEQDPVDRFCRSLGLSREEYRTVLEPLAEPVARTGRWHRR